MQKIDITEFVKESRQRLLDAIKSAGIPEAGMREIAHKKEPLGSYKLPVIIFALERPVAKFWLTFPEVEGQKTVKFNIETFSEVSKWLTQPPQQNPSPSSTMDAQSSS